MPEEAKNPTVVGHYQADTVHRKNQSGAMATAVDVSSKFIFARMMKDKTVYEVFYNVEKIAFES